MAVIILAVAASACAPRSDDRDARGTAPSVSQFDPTTRTILPMDIPPDVLGRCDRSIRAGESPEWIPSSTLVNMVDAQLKAVLDSVLTVASASVGRPVPQATDYYRQYAGVSSGKRRHVYINGFHKSLLGSAGTASDTVEWRIFPVAPCDAGVLRFGILFDVRDQSFTRLEFTDSFDGRVRH